MKKKWLIWLLVAALGSMILSSCSMTGAQTQAPAAESGEEEVTEEAAEDTGVLLPADAKVGICMNASAEGYERAYYSRLEKYLTNNGFVPENILLVESVTGEEKTAVLSLMGEGCDVILADCGEPQNAQVLRKIAVELGMPVVFIITEPEEEEIASWETNEWAIAYVGGDRSRIGELRETILDAIEFDTLDASGDHYIGCLVLDIADRSSEGVGANADTLQALETDHYKTEVLEHVVFGEETEDEEADFSDWSLDTDVSLISFETYDDAVKEIGKLIKDHKKSVEVILCADDMLALAAAEAVADNKRSIGHDVQILGSEATEDSLKAVASGEILGTIFNDYLAQSRKGADAALAFIKQEKVPSCTYCDYVKVTEENAKEILDVAAEAFSSSENEDSEEQSEEAAD